LPAGAEKGVVWAQPSLVCVVDFSGWTRDGMIRHASFRGLRDDKPAQDIALEAPQKRTETRADAAAAGVKLTHPERILWAEPGITKQGLADFYTDIADWILPHVTGRVLSLLRCPSGTGAKCFFAKHPWAGLIDDVRRIEVGTEEPMLAIDGLEGLLSLVQAGVVEIHPWGSPADDLERPDRLIFDLDPGDDVPWAAVIAAAREVRSRLEALGLKSFVKTTGGKGLHVMVPLAPGAGWDEAKAFTKSIAEAMAKDAPDRYVATIAKRARHGRILIDYLRNDLFDSRLAAGHGLDAAHLGRVVGTIAVRPFHRRQPPAPARISGARSLAGFLQGAAANSGEQWCVSVLKSPLSRLRGRVQKRPFDPAIEATIRGPALGDQSSLMSNCFTSAPYFA
jgi:bifunctional non-homologous end joining protein LigD